MADSGASFICADCGAKASSPGDCAACGKGPLLNLADPGVKSTLADADQQRILKRQRLLTWVAVPVAVILVLAVVGAAPFLLALIPLPIPFALPIKTIVLMVLAAFGLSRALVALFPERPRFPELAPDAGSAADAAKMKGGVSRKTIVALASLIGVGVVIAVASTALRASEVSRKAEVQEKAATSLSALSRCLLGEPLEMGESVDERLRAIELTLGPPKAGAASTGWPQRCSPHADALYSVLEGSSGPLRPLLGDKLGCASGRCSGEALTANAAAIFAAARAERIPQIDLAPEVVGPPVSKSLKLLKAADFPRVGPSDLLLRDLTWLDAGKAALLFQTSGGKLEVCEVEVEAGARIDCAPAHEQIAIAAASARLVRGEREPIIAGITKARAAGGRGVLGEDRAGGPDSARPDRRRGAGSAFGDSLGGGFAGLDLGGKAGGRGGKKPSARPRDVPEVDLKPAIERGAFNARTGEAVAVYHGEATSLRSGFVLEKDKEKLVVIAVRDGAEGARKSVELPAGGSSGFIEGDYLAWVGERDDEGKPRLMFRKLSQGQPLLGKERTAGPLAESAHGRPKVCRSGETVAALFGRGARASMAFLSADGWSAPVHAEREEVIAAPKPEPAAEPPAAPPVAAAASAGSESAAGKERPSRYEIKGPSDSTDPPIARQQALRDAAEFGMLGMLNNAGGASDSAPFGGGGLGATRGGEGGWRSPEFEAGYGDREGFVCGSGEATLTFQSASRGGLDVHQVRCSATECKAKRARLEGVRAKRFWAATDLDGKVLLVWRSEQGELRMRLAGIDDLAASSDIVLMDSPERGGPNTGEVQTLAHGSAAVFLFRSAALHGLLVEAGGDYAPIAGH